MNTPSPTIALLGGAFDPPHRGHFLLASYYLALHPDAALWLLPSFAHPFGKAMAPFEWRLQWCELMAQSLGSRAAVCNVEQTMQTSAQPRIGYTFDVIQALKLENPQVTKWVWLIGADAYAQRHTWHRAAELAQMVHFFVVGRGDVLSPQGGLAMPEISSSEIRRRLQQGESCEGLLLPAVAQAVQRSGCYLDVFSLT